MIKTSWLLLLGKHARQIWAVSLSARELVELMLNYSFIEQVEKEPQRPLMWRIQNFVKAQKNEQLCFRRTQRQMPEVQFSLSVQLALRGARNDAGFIRVCADFSWACRPSAAGFKKGVLFRLFVLRCACWVYWMATERICPCAEETARLLWHAWSVGILLPLC